MNICNELALHLLSTLSDPDHDVVLCEDGIVFNNQQCLIKITRYMEWIDQLNCRSVMLISTPSIDALCLCYALILSNKTYIPVHTSTSADLLQAYLDTFQVDLLLIQPLIAHQFGSELKFKAVENKDNGFFYYQTTMQHTFCLRPGIVLFTSGTTGLAKAVHYHYDTIFKYISWGLKEFDLRHDDTALFTTELSFAASLRPLFIPFLAGATIRFITDISSNKLQLIINALVNNTITLLNLTPTLFKKILPHVEKNRLLDHLASVRLILLSGEPIDADAINFWFSRVSPHTTFYNLYGTTECLIPLYKKINDPIEEPSRFHLGELRPGSDFKLVPDAAKGYELFITGDLSTAYFDENQTQNSYIINNNKRFIKTNDFVTLQEGQLFFLSRAQRIIKRYGQLINLDQIESVLKKEHDRLDFIAFSDEENDNKIYLIITGSPHDDDLLRAIQLSLNDSLPSYMHPSEYVFTKEIPLTPSGKINYLLIKKIFIKKPPYDISDYFRRFFHGKKFNKNTYITDLGLDSIDYIEMAEQFLKITGKWLDLAKINEETRISDITLCLRDVYLENLQPSHAVKINPLQGNYYANELNGKSEPAMYLITSYGLKGKIQVKQLEIAIAETLAQHFMLCSKLEWIDEDYYFVEGERQSHFKYQSPILFAKNALSRLKTSIHSNRLVQIYIERKKNQYYLLMTYHHIALDGWSALMLREEIFRRYQGIHPVKGLKREKEIEYLNQVNQIWPNENYNGSELKALLKNINPYTYNQLDSFFHGRIQNQNTFFVLPKNKVDRFAKNHYMTHCPYSVIFAFVLHQVICRESGVNKLFFYTSFSNRNLPVPHVKELLTNLAIGLPVFFDNTNLSVPEFVLQIKKNLNVYFKNMDYSSLMEIWRNEIISRPILNPNKQPYQIVYTYINKITDEEYIQNNYIDWNNSTVINNRSKPGVYLRVYNMGSEFIVLLNSHLKKGMHNRLADHIHELMNTGS